MRMFTRESVAAPPATPAGREMVAASANVPDAAAVPGKPRPRLPHVRPSLIVILVGGIAAWEIFSPATYKPSSLIGSVSGSIQSAMMRESMVSRAEMEAAVEAAKLAEQVRFQPLIGALDTAFKNCQAQTQALAQAQAQLIAQRAALATDGVRGRMSSGGAFETFGSWLNGLSPGAGDDLAQFGRAEREAAMREFERQALAQMPRITIDGGICGDNPAALVERMGIAAPAAATP